MKYHKSVLGKLIATIIMSFMTYIAEAQSSTNCCSQAQIITYRKSAKLGDAKAMFELGNCYANGIGVPKDEAEAFKWFHEAAEQCDKIDTMHRLKSEFVYILKAMFKLGNCYQNGRGITKSEEQGVTWYRKTIAFGEKIIANQGSKPADIGTVDSNDERIFLAELESAIIDISIPVGVRDVLGIAMIRLGICYAQGTGVPKDEAEAVQWCRKAADLGNALGMYNLGVCYYNGIGVPKDEAEAIKWYRKAADLDVAEAKEILAKIHSKEDKGQGFKWRYILYGICGLFGLIELFKKWRSARKK
jgi:TPR repeat protein